MVTSAVSAKMTTTPAPATAAFVDDNKLPSPCDALVARRMFSDQRSVPCMLWSGGVGVPAAEDDGGVSAYYSVVTQELWGGAACR